MGGQGGGDQVGKSPPEKSIKGGGANRWCAFPALDSPRSMQLLQLSLVLGLGDEGFLYLTRAWAIFGCTVEARIPLDLCLSVPGTLLLGLYISNRGREIVGGMYEGAS